MTNWKPRIMEKSEWAIKESCITRIKHKFSRPVGKKKQSKNTIENGKREVNAIQILKEIGVNVTSNDIEACHGIGKTKN